MNRGLGKYPPLLLAPILTATIVTFGMLGGGIVFNEFASFSGKQWVAYTVGLVCIVGGVLLLTSKSSSGGKKAN